MGCGRSSISSKEQLNANQIIQSNKPLGVESNKIGELNANNQNPLINTNPEATNKPPEIQANNEISQKIEVKKEEDIKASMEENQPINNKIIPNDNVEIKANNEQPVPLEQNVEIKANKEQPVSLDQNLEIKAASNEQSKPIEKNIEIIANIEQPVSLDQNIEIKANNDQPLSIEQNVEIKANNEQPVYLDQNLEIKANNEQPVPIEQNVEIKANYDQLVPIPNNQNLEINANNEQSATIIQVTEINGNKKETNSVNDYLDIFREEGLKVHNEFRSLHNAPPLNSNAEANKIAQDYAEKLSISGETMASKVEDRINMGENIFQCAIEKLDESSVKGKIILIFLTFLECAQNAVKAWYNEIKNFDFSNPELSTNSPFTQIVWNDTSSIGLGLAQAKEGSYIIIANYSPAGNVIGKYEANINKPK